MYPLIQEHVWAKINKKLILKVLESFIKVCLRHVLVVFESFIKIYMWVHLV